MANDQVPPAGSGDNPLSIDVMLLDQMPALLVFLRHQIGEELAARETVEDLAQSVCREVWQDRASLQFEDASRFRAYLFLQAVRKVVDRARFHRMGRRDVRRERELPQTHSAAEAGVYGTLVTGTQVVIAREKIALVEQVLQELPDGQREAVFLSRVAGLSYDEIAKHKGVAESTVRALVARGLTRLCMVLERKA
ncbi:MAG: sigma-70 family RNA polymerase sigma factor [Planctomycetota bacterium]